ncbi:MAG: HlyC/CorC family transporter [Clostridia bacterium]|nr:HlyC/CorC family transporter [Clostridia bacterium]
MEDPEPATGLIIQIVLLFVLILVNAFFAMSEIAIISLNDNKLERLAEEGNKKAKKVLKLTSNSSNFLSTIQIGVTLAGFLTSASASQSFVDMLFASIDNILPGIPDKVIETFSLIVITLITSYFSLVLGELAPKKIAMSNPEKISFAVVGILLFIQKITIPFVKILSLSTNGIVRIFGIDPHADAESVTEEEIRMMVDVGEEKGVIEDVQKEMINNIFEFDDIDAGDIMTHRTDIVAIEVDDPLEDVIKLSVEEGRSRIPVYEEELDNIIGVIHIKDLLPYIGHQLPGETTLRSIMREAYYIPESKRCGDLFKEMTENHTQLAIVVDEYGGTAGLLTIEDLLESIVGNIQDEFDDEEEEISKINETTFTIDGTTSIDEVDELVGVEIPEGDYDTLAGFLISMLGFLPKDEEMNEVEYKNLHFTILNVEDRRIGKVKVEILPLPESESEDDDDDTISRKERRERKERLKEKDKE